MVPGGRFLLASDKPQNPTPRAPVSCLLYQIFGGWNMALIRQVFGEDDVNIILQIPHNQSRGEDKLIWHFSNDGMYSVKSGYHTYMQQIREDRGLSSSLGHLWKKIWGALILNKFKHFIWRVA